ncbi:MULTISPECIES: hypothetical protein [unclassified Virgibacillus]|uniref:hypothetical protein n=1 Tax=unclassified Virgibacillus TaxID=2620237 RepID=UPI00090B95FC|nr:MULTISPECIES: hypothetical protein [unclassified Virgibacillus]API91180.1 hypothetical protein BKP57_04470 [Virgibacillus sp. 6R]MBS7429173.1 hypothetical protein [Virgibacillus sp. 19R1-5]
MAKDKTKSKNKSKQEINDMKQQKNKGAGRPFSNVANGTNQLNKGIMPLKTGVCRRLGGKPVFSRPSP